MLEVILTVATSDDGDQHGADLPRARSVKVPSETGAQLGIGRDPSRCTLVTPKNWQFVSRLHLQFAYDAQRGWTVEWIPGSHTRPVALVQISREGVSEQVPYGASLPLAHRVGRVVVSDLARRRRVVAQWRLSESARPGAPDHDNDLPPTEDLQPVVLWSRLSDTEREVLTAMSCDWIHGRTVKRAKSTGELCKLLHLSAATVERCKTKLRREFYSSGMCPELNELLGPNYLEAVRHVHGGWDLIAQTAVTRRVLGGDPCPCGGAGTA